MVRGSPPSWGVDFLSLGVGREVQAARRGRQGFIYCDLRRGFNNKLNDEMRNEKGLSGEGGGKAADSYKIRSGSGC